MEIKGQQKPLKNITKKTAYKLINLINFLFY